MPLQKCLKEKETESLLFLEIISFVAVVCCCCFLWLLWLVAAFNIQQHKLSINLNWNAIGKNCVVF